jgi:hypothetical protein
MPTQSDTPSQTPASVASAAPTAAPASGGAGAYWGNLAKKQASRIIKSAPGAAIDFARRLGGGKPSTEQKGVEIFVPSTRSLISYINKAQTGTVDGILDDRPVITVKYLLEAGDNVLPADAKNKIKEYLPKLSETEALILKSQTQTESETVKIVYSAEKKLWVAFATSTSYETAQQSKQVYAVLPLDVVIKYINDNGIKLNEYAEKMLPLDVNAIENYNPTGTDVTTEFLKKLKDWKGTGNQKIVNTLKKEITFLVHSNNTIEILTNPDEIKRTGIASKDVAKYQQTISIGYVKGVESKTDNGKVINEPKAGIFAYKSAGPDIFNGTAATSPANQTNQTTFPFESQSESFNTAFNKALKRFE